MTIQITGKGEKRAVVYPLLHILSRFNGGLLATDDGMYRRIITDDDGVVSNIRICVYADTTPDALKTHGIYTHAFDAIVRDTGEVMEADKVIRVSRAHPDDEEDAAEHEYKLCVDFEHTRNSKDKTPFLPLTLPLLRELRDIETSGRFGQFRNRAAIKVLSPVFADIFGISKQDVQKLLKKEGRLS